MIFQASLLIVAVAVYWSGSLSQRTPLLFFLCLIVSSISTFYCTYTKSNIPGRIRGNTKGFDRQAIGDEDDFMATTAAAKQSISTLCSILSQLKIAFTLFA